MGLLKEFRDFAVKGNVVDMAVGIIIGAAFGKIVSSLVDDVLMPPLGMAMGQMDFSTFALTLAPAQGDKPPVLLKYGMLINTLINFTIVAFALFILIKAVNAAKRQEAAAPPAPAAPPPQEMLLAEIRDILKKSAR